jgi:hypothetical protein
MYFFNASINSLQYHNWDMIVPLKDQAPREHERWGRAIDRLEQPILPFDRRDRDVEEYNNALLTWAEEAFADDAPAGGADLEDPPTLFKREQKPKQEKKIDGGAPYLDLVTDETGVTRVEGAPVNFGLK